MKHCLVDLYESCSNHSPGVKIGPVLRSLISLYRYSENLKGHLNLLTQVIELGPHGPLVFLFHSIEWREQYTISTRCSPANKCNKNEIDSNRKVLLRFTLTSQ